MTSIMSCITLNTKIKKLETIIAGFYRVKICVHNASGREGGRETTYESEILYDFYYFLWVIMCLVHLAQKSRFVMEMSAQPISERERKMPQKMSETLKSEHAYIHNSCIQWASKISNHICHAQKTTHRRCRPNISIKRKIE